MDEKLITWDLSVLYADAEAWEKDFARLEEKAKNFYAYKGRLAESPAILKAAIEASDELDRFGEKLYTYAHLLSDENTSIGKNRARVDRICAKFAANFWRLDSPMWLCHPLILIRILLCL